jgi:hypothetical protein
MGFFSRNLKGKRSVERKPSGSIKGAEFLGQLSVYQLLKTYSIPWS